MHVQIKWAILQVKIAHTLIYTVMESENKFTFLFAHYIGLATQL